MAENSFKSNIITGLAAGVGATLLAPVLLPFLASIVRPATKAAIKGGVVLYEKGRESLAEFSETVDDLVAEAKSEMETGAPGSVAAGAWATPGATTQGRTPPPPAQPRQDSDISQSSANAAPAQTNQAGKPAPSPAAPSPTKSEHGSQRGEGTQGPTPTEGE